MEKLCNKQIFIWCSFFIFLVLHLRPATSQEVEDERDFDYGELSGRGPGLWGRIRPEWNMCNNGSMQSPIDFSDRMVEVISMLQRLNWNYRPSNAIIKNRGHDIMLRWNYNEAGHLEINGTQYFLQQCHWHSPSEHTINGKKFDLELHIVHQSPTGQIVVIGIMYGIGNHPDSFLSSVEAHLKVMANMTNITGQEQANLGMVDPMRIKIRSRRYYRYVGSLTVPPCTQNVLWIVVQQIKTVTLEQVNLLRLAVRDGSELNARPLQHKRGRSVKLCATRKKIKNNNYFKSTTSSLLYHHHE